MKRRFYGFILALAMLVPCLTAPMAASAAQTYVAPIKIYPISTGNNTPMYSFVGASTASGTVYAEDLCTILESYNSGWLKVNYPVAGGSRTLYTPTRYFIGNPDYRVSQVHVTVNAPVYRRSNLSGAKFGDVYTSDTVYIVDEANSFNSCQVIYNISGGWKCGWISRKYVRELNGPVEPTAKVKIASSVIPKALSSGCDNAVVADISAANIAAGARLQIWGVAGVKNQLFRFYSYSDGTHRIMAHHSGKYLEVTDNGDYAPVVQGVLSTSSRQKWYLYSAGGGYYYLKNAASGRYLDLYCGITQNGTTVRVCPFNGSSAQKWKLITSTAAPTCPALTITKGYPTLFDWASSANATSYQLSISGSASGSARTGRPSSLHADLGVGKYTIRLTAYNDFNKKSSSRQYSLNITSDYNATKARDYAHKYWEKYNPAYPRYAGNDCANFVSQCVLAGGLKITSNGSTLPLCSNLLNRLVAMGGTVTYKPSAKDIAAGDVLFYYNANGSTYSNVALEHTAIVCEVKNGVPWVCAHTNDRHYSNWTMGYPYYLVVKMKNTRN